MNGPAFRVLPISSLPVRFTAMFDGLNVNLFNGK